MIGLGASPEAGFLGLDKVADMGILANVAAGTKVSEWTDFRAIGHQAVGENAALAQ